jgi:hypothetical protein
MIVAVVAQGRFDGVVVVVVVVTVIMGDMLDAGEVRGAGILADVMGVTIYMTTRGRCRSVPRGDRGVVRVGAYLVGVRAWANISLTWWAQRSK